jgi:hypothetical protein
MTWKMTWKMQQAGEHERAVGFAGAKIFFEMTHHGDAFDRRLA